MVLAIVLAATFLAACGSDRNQQSGTGGGSNRVARTVPDEVLSREPYMGVSCPIPNSFACDRVGLAVWLREPAVRVHAAIAGMGFELDDPEWSGPSERGERRMFAGFLQPAGLIDGPLEVTPDAGPDRWIGRSAVSAPVDLQIVREDGAADATSVDVRLSPGWG